MKYDLVMVIWQDIVSSTNNPRYSEPTIQPTLSFGVLFKRYAHNGVKYIRLLTTAVKSDEVGDTSTDDTLDIPVGCICKISHLRKIDIGKHHEVKMKRSI